jgi:hypothetical protein
MQTATLGKKQSLFGTKTTLLNKQLVKPSITRPDKMHLRSDSKEALGPSK